MQQRKNVYCVRETEILVEQQPPLGVFVCDHAGLVINKFSSLQRKKIGHSMGEDAVESLTACLGR